MPAVFLDPAGPTSIKEEMALWVHGKGPARPRIPILPFRYGV